MVPTLVSFRLSLGGEAMFRLVEEAIGRARREVLVSVFTLADDFVGGRGGQVLDQLTTCFDRLKASSMEGTIGWSPALARALSDPLYAVAEALLGRTGLASAKWNTMFAAGHESCQTR